MREMLTALLTGEYALVRVLGVLVLIGTLVSSLLLMWADSEEGEEAADE